MRKRIVTLLLATLLVLSIGVQMASAAGSDYYRVGYAKVDINPYNENTPEPNDLAAIPMAGNGFSDKRWSYPDKIDDNGDGKVDENDGLFATCIAITDQTGNTLLQFSVDTINASPLYVNPVRQRLVEKFPELSADRIMFNASHTHSGPELSTKWKSGSACSDAYNAYMERLLDQLVLAGEMAMADRTPATMYKGRMEANESKAIKGDIGDTLNEGRPANDQVTVLDGEAFPDRVYNAVRHYLVEATSAQRKVLRSKTAVNTVTLSDGTKVGQYAYYSYPKENGQYIPDPNGTSFYYCGGDNFNGVSAKGTHSAAAVYFVNMQGKEVTEEYYAANAGTRAWWAADMNVVSNVEHVSETDDTLQLLEFRFDAKYNKKPIVLVNWRAHMTMNRSVSADYRANATLAALGNYTSYYQMSGDWANALRFALERKGYRPAFLQGAAGNINGGSRIPEESSWLNYLPEAKDSKGNVIKGTGAGYYEGVKLADTSYAMNKGNIYGSELSEVVMECLSEHMTQINKKGGELNTVQVKFQTERQPVTFAGYQAGKYYAEHYNPASPTGLYTHHYTYWVDANGTPIVDETGTPLTDEDGNVLTDANGNPVTDLVPAEKKTETYKITSIHHANSQINKFSSNNVPSAALELNAIMIGDEFAMVTAPNELFDRYSETSNQYDMTDNLWTIVDDYTPGSYGEPFIAGYSNGANSYLPSYATYFLSEDNDKYATGSYETLTSQYAPGNGEAVIHTFDLMLEFLQERNANKPETSEGYCGCCGKDVTWTKLTEDTGKISIPNIRTGHYYLDGDLTLTGKQIMIGAEVCLDLRGHTLTVKKGMTVGAGATLNLLGQGVVQGDDAPSDGGVFDVAEGATLNVYEAILRYVGEATTDGPITNGGILNVMGTLNLYGGVVEGTTINWAGAAIYSGSQSHLNFYGGQVITGNAGAAGNCIYARGHILLTGSAIVPDVRIMPKGDGPALEDMITVTGRFDGTANFTINNTTNGMDIGTADNAEIANARITAGSKRVMISDDGTQLVLGAAKGAAVVFPDGTMTYASGLAQATELCNEKGGYVVLQKKSTQDVSVSKELLLDLNGYDATGDITVEEGSTLYVMDFSTADYDVSDGKYGELQAVTGNVQGAPATESRDVYMSVKSESGVSFHAVDLNIDSMALRPTNGGMYYVNHFGADEVAREQIAAYGIAMSVTEEPNNENLGKTNKLTRFEDALGTATGTLLSGVMKPENGRATNSRNASMPVYGRAYVELKDGSYLFGITRCRSLQQQVELADTQWQLLSKEAQAELRAFYQTYKTTMKTWNIPNILGN